MSVQVTQNPTIDTARIPEFACLPQTKDLVVALVNASNALSHLPLTLPRQATVSAALSNQEVVGGLSQEARQILADIAEFCVLHSAQLGLMAEAVSNVLRGVAITILVCKDEVISASAALAEIRAACEDYNQFAGALKDSLLAKVSREQLDLLPELLPLFDTFASNGKAAEICMKQVAAINNMYIDMGIENNVAVH